MRHEDRFKDERAKIERALDALEKAAARIEAGDAPNAQTAPTVAVLIDTEEAAYDDSEVGDDEPVLSVCVAEHEAARVLLRRLKAALDARERGDIAAGRLFAQNARDYVSLRREHMKRDDRLFAKVPGSAQA
jgi:hemerythrin-like domain-containing protein